LSSVSQPDLSRTAKIAIGIIEKKLRDRMMEHLQTGLIADGGGKARRHCGPS
jgi:hypothetical protein